MLQCLVDFQVTLCLVLLSAVQFTTALHHRDTAGHVAKMAVIDKVNDIMPLKVPVVRPQSFGAIADGSTNDTAAIVSAAAHCAGLGGTHTPKKLITCT